MLGCMCGFDTDGGAICVQQSLCFFSFFTISLALLPSLLLFPFLHFSSLPQISTQIVNSLFISASIKPQTNSPPSKTVPCNTAKTCSDDNGCVAGSVCHARTCCGFNVCAPMGYCGGGGTGLKMMVRETPVGGGSGGRSVNLRRGGGSGGP